MSLAIDPAIARFVAESVEFFPPDAAHRPVVEQRRLYESYAAAFAVRRPPEVSSRDGTLEVGDRAIPLRLYRPDRVAAHGTVVFAHGGGFVLGSLDSHDGIAARVAEAVGAPVIAVDYRLAPEHRAPAARDDVLAVVAALDQGQLPWADLPVGRFALMGDSAGGTLACSAALRLQGTARDRLRALALVYPMLGYEPAEPARTQWAQAPNLTLADLHAYRTAYLGPDGGPGSFPLDGSDLSALPPTVLLPAAVDPLRDDCTVLAGRLHALGTPVELLPGTGLVHGALRAVDRTPAMAEPFGRVCAFVAGRLAA